MAGQGGQGVKNRMELRVHGLGQAKAEATGAGPAS